MEDESGIRRLSRALPELIIIVVGVLAALAVDHWNSGRADRALEISYLDALLTDLRADSVEFADVLVPALAQKESGLSAIAPVVRGHAPVPEDTLQFLRMAALGGRLGGGPELGTSTTYEELVATGALRLIGSPSLRSRLVAHYRSLELGTMRIRMRTSGYPMLIHEYYPGEMRGAHTDSIVRIFGLLRAVEGLRSDRFNSVLNQEFNMLFFMRSTIDRLRDETNVLLGHVDRERARLSGN